MRLLFRVLVSASVVISCAPVKPAVAPLTAEAEFATPCAEGAKDYEDADAALFALSKQIEALPLDADPKPLASRIDQLLETRCFRVVTSRYERARVKSALSLKTFWKDGGENAVLSALRLAKPADRWVGVVPTIRTALTIENAPKHPLASLLCPASAALGESDCGRETRAYVIRADKALRRHAQIRRLEWAESVRDLPTYERCVDIAKAGKNFDAFRRCVDDVPLRQDALPLGRFRAPSSGWLVVRGRRGNYTSCDETSAYDLATGVAYVKTTCEPLPSAPPAATPRTEIRQGRVPIAALREAAWMIVFATTAERDVLVMGETYSVPDGIPILTDMRDFGLRGGSHSSGWARFVFQWVRDGKNVVNGTMSWPNAYDGANQHAVDLLAIAEADFVEDRPNAQFPAIPEPADAQ